VHAAGLRDAPDVVAPQIDQHDVLGALLGVGQQLVGKRRVFGWCRAAPPRAGDRPHRDRIASSRTRISGEAPTTWNSPKS